IANTPRYPTLDNAANQGRNRGAIELAREYLQAGPDASILVTLGRCQINLGDYAGAEQSLRDALKLTPDHVQPNYLLSKAVCAQAEILWQQDADKTSALSRFHEAANLAQKAIAAQGDHAMAHLIFGICRL